MLSTCVGTRNSSWSTGCLGRGEAVSYVIASWEEMAMRWEEVSTSSVPTDALPRLYSPHNLPQSSAPSQPQKTSRQPRGFLQRVGRDYLHEERESVQHVVARIERRGGDGEFFE